MIELSDTALAALASGSWRYQLRVESWRGGELLHDDVPVDTGREMSDRSLRVPDRVELTVPLVVDGYRWEPGDAEDHPLAPWGQRIRVNLGVGLAADEVEWFTRGEFLITSAKADGDRVSVTAESLFRLIEEAQFVTPFQPSGTMAATLRALVEPALTVVVDDSLADRNVPAAIEFGDDRLAAVYEVLDAWAADARIMPDGYLYVYPSGDPAESLYSLSANTIGRSADVEREDIVNAVVARGSASDGTQVQAAAYDTSALSPARYGGPYNPLPVPEYFYSPLLTTQAQCYAAAQTRLRRRYRAARRPFGVSTPPLPHILCGDPVTSRDGKFCTVETLQLPYTADGGAMDMTLREIW